MKNNVESNLKLFLDSDKIQTLFWTGKIPSLAYIEVPVVPNLPVQFSNCDNSALFRMFFKLLIAARRKFLNFYFRLSVIFKFLFFACLWFFLFQGTYSAESKNACLWTFFSFRYFAKSQNACLWTFFLIFQIFSGKSERPVPGVLGAGVAAPAQDLAPPLPPGPANPWSASQ